MPVVHIYMFPGRTKEQKNELVKRISKDFQDVANVKPEALNILSTTRPKKIGAYAVRWRRNNSTTGKRSDGPL